MEVNLLVLITVWPCSMDLIVNVLYVIKFSGLLILLFLQDVGSQLVSN